MSAIRTRLVPESGGGLEQTWTAGIDEVGRGSLAGPVIAAAVVFDPLAVPIDGLDDSKRLSAGRREQLALSIMSRARAWSIGRAEASEVDALNVLRASLMAMRRAVDGLGVRPDWLRVDGNHFPPVAIPGEAIVRGDGLYPEIMAASILAKVFRDREMVLLDLLYPGYGFLRNKGYPTSAHRLQLGRRGISAAHRRSFAPVLRCLS